MSWRKPTGTLGMLAERAHDQARTLRLRRADLERLAGAVAPRPRLDDALAGTAVAVIAEIKRRSPSRGDISLSIDARTQALAYAEGGAAAVSVLTERDHFGGRPEDIGAAAVAGLPLLRKDFHVDPVQLAEARALGASAALLIVRALEPGALEDMINAALSLELEVVVEVRDTDELERALRAGALIIGVNNRDLETLRIDPATTDRIIPLIPRDRVAVAESGVRSVEDVRVMARAGADAVLVGSAVSAAASPADAVRALTCVTRQASSG